jgi:MSHA biogenesis protein MshQ
MYWNGANWQTNSADNCTSIPANSLVLGNWKPGSFSGPMDSSHLPGSPLALSSGTAALTITKPSPAAAGSVDLAINLGGTGADNNCIGAGMTATGANLSWLRGSWCSGGYVRDPNARLTFGTSRSPFIYLREMY